MKARITSDQTPESMGHLPFVDFLNSSPERH